jgi:hypothetical protein
VRLANPGDEVGGCTDLGDAVADGIEEAGKVGVGYPGRGVTVGTGVFRLLSRVAKRPGVRAAESFKMSSIRLNSIGGRCNANRSAL